MDKFNATCWIIMTLLHTVYCSTSASCVDSCVGKTTGNYQYCPDCHQYMACSNGYKYVMPCPANLVWDDAKKRCEWTSSTCNIYKNNTSTAATNTGCDDSCVGKTTGNYQYCPDCHQYMACSNGYKYVMPCPANLVWDDAKKRCEWTSSTCNIYKNNTSTAATNTACVDSCLGRNDGNYQYCPDFHQYIACTNGYKYVIPCPANHVWDDVNKICKLESSELYISPKSTSVTASTVKKATPTTITNTTDPSVKNDKTRHNSTTARTITTTAAKTSATTDYFVKNDTTRHTSTTARTIITTSAKTSATTAKPTAVTNCIQEKLSIFLEKDVPIMTGSVPFISVLDGSNGNRRFGCNSKVLLKATFQRSDLQSSLQGCNNTPHFGNKMLKIDMRISSIINGISFHVGDSQHNIGSRKDESMQENDAEFYFLGYSCMLHGGRNCSSFTKDLTGFLNVNVSRVTVYVSNEFIRVTNNLGYTYELCSSCLFALNGQPDSVDSRNQEINIGLNRPIYSPINREGTGVCRADISWTCP